MNVLLFGYYGYNNIGDDCMLMGLLENLIKYENVKKVFVVIFNDQNNKIIKNDKIKKISINNNYDKIRILSYMFLTDVAVWGGGTALYEKDDGDIKGVKKILKIIKFLKIIGKKYVLLNIGIGKCENKKTKIIIRKILSKAYLIIFREINSLKKAQDIIASKNKYSIGGDMVFLLKNYIENISQTLKRKGQKKILVFSGVCEYKDNDQLVYIYSDIIRNAILLMDIYVIFLPCHQGQNNDNLFHEKLKEKINNNNCDIYNYRDLDEYVGIVKSADIVISMRLHGMVLADICRIPVIGVMYSPKIEYYNNLFDGLSDRVCRLGEYIDIEKINTVVNNYENNSKKIDRVMERQKIMVLNSIETFINNIK
jgi:L-malate glycosyltransferase